MICTFCGTENPQGNRFCGMCGVRMERRKSERRIDQEGTTTCPDCGHVNEPAYKFCGMCGVKVDRRTMERRGANGAVRANAMANAQMPMPDPRKGQPQRRPGSTTALLEREQPEAGRHHDVASSVAGPSFLGLSDSPTEAEYLLEDDAPRHRGLRAFLLLVVLAAIVGLIYVQYRSSLRANPRSPTPPDPGAATVPRSEGANRMPVQNKALLVAAAAHNLQSAVTDVSKAAKLAPAKEDDTVAKNKGGASAGKAGKGKEEADDPPDASNTASVASDKPSPALIKAQKYLHGQGVRQNCEQGLIYLRAAARDNDPKAVVQMGALYSSGFCVAQDRVKAYQWFSTAREMEPDNRWIAKNLDQLWARMTPRERQLIHR